MDANIKPQKNYKLRVAICLAAVLLFLVTLNVASQAVSTLRELDRVEAERDQWQRPDDVLRALDLKPGNTVVDLGSGAGYFALKLSDAVGDRGKVLAVDLRRLSLVFLWIRSITRHQSVSIIIGDPDNPRLGTTVVDAVLVANTYHELSDSKSILTHISTALRPGGRLVVVDRAPASHDTPRSETGIDDHEIPVTRVENELAQQGFSLVNVEPDFINRAEDHWWLIVAQKP